MSITKDRIDDIAQLAVGVSFDFDSNQWIAKFGSTINIFPLPNRVAETSSEEDLGGALAGMTVPNYPFEQAYLEASKWFLGLCASQRAKAAKDGKKGGKKERTPTKRRTSTPTEARPQKRVATEERVAPRDDKSSAPSPPPSEAKANYPVLSAEIGVKSVHTVSDYRVQDREEQYLITGKIGSAGPLENWWIRLENVAGNQSAISKLKNYRKNYIYRNNAARKAEAQDLQEDDADEDEDQEYEVECLLDVRVVGKKEEFLVKWKDYPPAENTWEPIANLTGVEPSELEQCRQKQAHLIVPKSSRSAPSGKVDVNAEPPKSVAEGQAAHTKDFAGETSGTAAKAGSADEAQQSAAAVGAEEEGPSGVVEVVGAFEEVSYQPHGQEQVDLPPAGDTRPPVEDAIMGEMVGSDEGGVEDDGDVIFEDVVVDEGPHEGVGGPPGE